MDIVDLAGFRAQLADTASTFEAATFTASERSAAARKPSGDPAVHLAARFAAKEALIKAWSASRWNEAAEVESLDWHEIEVIQDHRGRPALQLTGVVGQALAGLHPHVSLSHDGGYASAVVILENRASAPGER